MPLAVLRKIRDLVDAGAVVVGPKPTKPEPRGRRGRVQDDRRRAVGRAPARARTARHGQGLRRPPSPRPWRGSKVPPDFEHTKPQADTTLPFVHRTFADGDVYWVNNRSRAGRGRGSDLPRDGQGARAVARGHRAVEPASLPRRRRPHHRAAAPGAVTTRCSSCSARPATAPSRTVPATVEADARGRGRALGRRASSPAAARRPASRCDTLASWSEHADAGSEVLLRHRHLHRDGPGSARLVRPGRGSGSISAT